MLNKMSITWNAKQVVNMVAKGKCSFDNIVQRSYVWENARKSNLIHSMIEGYPVPPFYTRRIDGKYDFLDGKNRIEAIRGFFKDEYELSNMPPITYEPLDGDGEETIDLNGYRFSELPEEIADILNSFPLTIYYYEDISDIQVATLFRKLNNGKPLSTKDRNIASCIDIRNVVNIGEHKLFKDIMSSKGLSSRKHLPIIMKMWCMLNQENPSFESKVFNDVMANTVITEEENAELKAVLDMLHDVYYELNDYSEDKKQIKLLKRKLGSETHLISFVPFVKKAIEENITAKNLADFFGYFYGDMSDASISEVYNETCKGGSAKAINIARRNDELTAAWNEFFAEDIIEEAV